MRAWRDHASVYSVVGVLALVTASGLFVTIAEDVATADPLTRMDLAVVNWFHARNRPAVAGWMQWVSNFHGVMAITIYSVLLAIHLFWKHEWSWLVFLVAVVPGGILVNETMIPSGHVAGATLFYGSSS